MFKRLFIIFIAIFAVIGQIEAANFTTKARSAYLVDFDSGAVIVSKDADVLMPPSSMIKMMTLYMLFDAVKNGDLKLDSKMAVSENADYRGKAWPTASKICLVKGQQLKVSDAILGIIVMSGGDASIVVAEKIAGSEQKFATMMQKKARELGMRESTFGNSSGLPNPDNLMTSHELAILADRLIRDFPDLYPMFKTRRFEFNDYKTDWCKTWGEHHTMNYNKLLFNMGGADGLKTGHTNEGGFGMTASAVRGGRRLIAVINGFKANDHQQLAAEVKRLLEFGFNNTSNKVFYRPGDEVVRVPVWYGKKADVDLTVKYPAVVTYNVGAAPKITVYARFNDPLPAPIKRGDEVGKLYIQTGEKVTEVPLVAKHSVKKVQFIGRVIKNISVLFGGK